jgi:hypothetical protein
VPTYTCWKLEVDGVVVDLRRIPITATSALAVAARGVWERVEDARAYLACARELAVRRLTGTGFVREGGPESTAGRTRQRFAMPGTPHRATVCERTVRIYVADGDRARYLAVFKLGVQEDRMAAILDDLAREYEGRERSRRGPGDRAPARRGSPAAGAPATEAR